MKISNLLLSALTFAPLVGSQPAYCGVGGWTNPIEVGECVEASTFMRAPTIWSDCGYFIGESQWYAFNGTGSTVTASTCNEGTTLDTRISIFENSCSDTSLTVCAGWNDNACGSQSSITIDTKEGTTYYVAIDGVDRTKGSFAFLISDGNMSQTENCTPPTCQTRLCDNAEDIFVENTVVASMTHGFYSPISDQFVSCGFGILEPSPFHKVKDYRFRSGGGNATAVFCSMNYTHDIALQVWTRGCDDSYLCPRCHAFMIVAALECEELVFDTEADTDYYLRTTTASYVTGSAPFNLTLSGTGAPVYPTVSQAALLGPTQVPIPTSEMPSLSGTGYPTVPPAAFLGPTQVPIPTSEMPSAAGETRGPTMVANDGACSCSCEVDADESTKFDCRHLKLMLNESDTESKCTDYCKSVHLPESCSSYNIFHVLTCPADYVFQAQCACMTEIGACQVADTWFGERNMTSEACSSNCQTSSRFARTCKLQDGASFSTAATRGIIDVTGHSGGFGIELCEDDSVGCGKTLLFALDELDSSCSCVCKSDRCNDVLNGISHLNTLEQCTQYCQTKSPCSIVKEIEANIFLNCFRSDGCVSATWIPTPLTLLLLITVWYLH